MMRRWLLFLFVLMAAQGFADETDDVMSGQARQASAVSVFQSEQQAEELTKANGERILFSCLRTHTAGGYPRVS